MTRVPTILLFLLRAATFQGAVVRSPDELRDEPAAEVSPDLDRSGSMDTTTGFSAITSESVQLYQGSLPKLPGTMDKPWLTLHSPIKMYIPIRYTDASSAESPKCVRCPRNWTVYLRPRQAHILSPVPTLSICPSLAQMPGRVHVAVVSGPRPGQRLSAGQHLVELVLWKADGPVHSCTYTVTVKGRKRPVIRTTPLPPKRKLFPCVKPDIPPGGAVVCDSGGENRRHFPHGGVCQFICLPYHSIENTTNSSITAICNDGQWLPHDRVICVATTCPIPAPPFRGVWDCDSEYEESTLDHVKGTRCRIRCEEGYVVPTSQLQGTILLCTPPSWNNTRKMTRCKRAHLPKLLHCHDRHLIVRAGLQVPVSDKLLPRGADNRGAFLEPVCTLRKGWNLSGGEYRNECKVTDPELRTRKNCSYSIHLEESSGPRPYPDDCLNHTLIVDPGSTASLDTVRFMVSVGQPARTKDLIAQCSSQKPLVAGRHLVRCTATDPNTRATNSCSFWLTVKEKSCPVLPPIPNGHLICPSRVVGARCYYECAPGFSMRAHHPERTCRPNLKWHTDAVTVCEQISCPVLRPIPNGQVICPSRVVGARCRYECDPGYSMREPQEEKKCRPDLKWHPSTAPTCEIQSPVLVSGCEELTLTASPPLNVSVPLPVFLTPLNETVTVLCMPNLLTELGEQRVRCDAGPSSCFFNVTILPKDGRPTSSMTDVVTVTTVREDIGTTASLTDIVHVITLLEDGGTTLSSFDISSAPLPEEEDSTASLTHVDVVTVLEEEGSRTTPTEVNVNTLFDVGGSTASLTNGNIATVLEEEGSITPTNVNVVTLLDVDGSTTSPINFNVDTVLEEEGTSPSPANGNVATLLKEGGSVTPTNVNVDTQLDVGGSTASPTNVNIATVLEEGESTASPTSVHLATELNEGGLTTLTHVNIATLFEEDGSTTSSTTVNSGTLPTEGQLTALPAINATVVTLLEEGESTALPTDVNFPTLLEKRQETVSPIGVSLTIPTSVRGTTDSPTEVVNVTALLEDEGATAPPTDTINVSTVGSCEPLQAPLHGSLECTVEEEEDEECHVICDPGHDFPDDYPMTVRCEDGLWDFQESDIRVTLPDCLAQMEGTAVEVWMGFEATALHCDEDLENQIRAIVEKESLCPPVTRCDTSVNCTLDEESDTMMVSVNWAVQADFDWEEDEALGEDIPEAETRLERALGNGRALLASGEIPGLHLFRDSFRRGLITLVCPEGFKADMMAAKCVECSRTRDDLDAQCWTRN